MHEMTPVEDHEGLWVKREDLLVAPNGVTGKLRAASYLVALAQARGAERVVYGGSVQSPAVARVATAAALAGMPATIVIGATTPEKAATRHAPIYLAMQATADFQVLKVAYNPALQREVKRLTRAHRNWFEIAFGISTCTSASATEVADFLRVDAPQVDNLPDMVDTLVMTLGSGNTAAAVLYGLLTRGGPLGLRKVVLLSVGPLKWAWVAERLAQVGHPLSSWPFEVEVHQLYPHFAKWGDMMPERLSTGLELHPAYEGKLVRWCNLHKPSWWTVRDGGTCLWIVGGPIPGIPK